MYQRPLFSCHRLVELVVDIAEIQDLNDVGMVQVGRQAGLVDEHIDVLRVFRQVP